MLDRRMDIFIFRAAEEQNGRTKDKILYSWENEIKKSFALKQTKSLISTSLNGYYGRFALCCLLRGIKASTCFGHKARSIYKVSSQLSIYTVLQEMF